MPYFQLREWRSVVLPLAIGFLLLIGVIAATTWFGVQRGLANAAVQRTLDIELQLSELLSLVQDAETGQRGYLLTGDEIYLVPYEAALRAVPVEMQRLRALMSGSARQMQHLAALKKVIDDKFAELASTIGRRRAGAVGEALAQIREGTGKELMDRARAILGEMRAEQGGLLIRQQALVEAANTRMQFGTVAAFLLLLGVAGFALVKIQQQTLGLIATNVDLQSAHAKLVQEALQRERLEAQLRQTQKTEAIG